MSKNNLIDLHCFDREIGRIGFDEDRNASFFQYNPAFLAEGLYQNMFPRIIKRIPQPQVFSKYTSPTFQGLPPMFADSLPDVFGNIVFKAWIESAHKDFKKISVLQQLAYVGKRGMGALEYMPAKEVHGSATINIDEITEVVNKVLENKSETKATALDHASLLNIFKIGTSAGGVRPKILVSEHKETGVIIPGDLVYSEDYDHYLVKLGVEEELSYSRERLEFAYYQAADSLGITMMPTKLIDNRHFATLRFDRQNGTKKHVLTATGITGWDYKDMAVSSYENLFDLAVYLKIPHRDIDELFRRMVFNLVFANHDDHLKNHSFLYDKDTDKWSLAPAYDITYSLNPELSYKKVLRVLSINGKRVDIELNDILAIGEKYTIKNATGIIRDVQDAIPFWITAADNIGIPQKIIGTICRDFKKYV